MSNRKFYIGKVQKGSPPHNLLYPITLYAYDDISAEAAIRAMSEISADDNVTVRAIRTTHEGFFGRSLADQRGCVQHFDTVWSAPGPFSPIDLFE